MQISTTETESYGDIAYHIRVLHNEAPARCSLFLSEVHPVVTIML